MNLTVLSGIRSTAPTLHIGNWAGAVRQFLHFQQLFPGQCYFFVADLHSIGDVKEGQNLRANTLSIAIEFFAAGVDPEKSSVYIQSQVPELATMTWLLTGAVNDTELLNLPHYREKRDKFTKGQEVAGAPSTYLVYPILQAADILFSGGAGDMVLVPVGADQRPHIEFTRGVADRFNDRYGALFPRCQMPEDVGYSFQHSNVRVRGLDGNEKMGKSDGNAIYMEDSPQLITSLIRKGVTDPSRFRRSDPGSPANCRGIYPLHELVSKPDRLTEISRGCSDGSLACSDCKSELADVVSDMFSEFRERKRELAAHPSRVMEPLMDASAAVRRKVHEKLEEMSTAMGLFLPGQKRAQFQAMPSSVSDEHTKPAFTSDTDASLAGEVWSAIRSIEKDPQRLDELKLRVEAHLLTMPDECADAANWREWHQILAVRSERYRQARNALMSG